MSQEVLVPPSADTALLIPHEPTPASTTCVGCAHPRDVHDSIAMRYCDATASSKLPRGCICKLPAG